MIIKDAVETWVTYKDSNFYDEDKAKKVIDARLTIKNALSEGYTLCRMDIIFDTLQSLKGSGDIADGILENIEDILLKNSCM